MLDVIHAQKLGFLGQPFTRVVDQHAADRQVGDRSHHRQGKQGRQHEAKEQPLAYATPECLAQQHDSVILGQTDEAAIAGTDDVVPSFGACDLLGGCAVLADAVQVEVWGATIILSGRTTFMMAGGEESKAA
jgi:hypothetical protein